MGNSLVMLHTDKSLEVWTEIREELDWFPCEREDLLQPRLVSPTPATGGRRLFMALRRVLPGAAPLVLADKARWLAGLLRRMKGG